MLLWEKEKAPTVKWVKQRESYSNEGGYIQSGVYPDYEIRDGRFYGGEYKFSYIGHKTYYVLRDGADTIKKLVYVKSTYTQVNGYKRETLHFDVYIGSLVWDYVN